MKIFAVLASLAVGSSLLLNSCGAILSGLLGSSVRQEVSVETKAPETPNLEFADYEIIREDRSFLDEKSKKPLIEIYYDRVEVAENVPGAEAINAHISAQCEAFLGQRDGLETNLEFPGLSTDSPFYCTSVAEVTHNGGGVFSVRSSESWFMGGVGNYNLSGLTFDMKTGQLLTLAELCPQKEGQIRELALAWMEETYGEEDFFGREETLAKYAYEEIPFFILNGQVVLCFPTYTFAAGASGPTIIETGLLIGG